MIASSTVFSRRPSSNLPQSFPGKFGSSGDTSCSLLLVLTLDPLTNIFILLFDHPRTTLYPRTWPMAQYSYSAHLSPQAFFIAHAGSYLFLINLAIINSILLEKNIHSFLNTKLTVSHYSKSNMKCMI